MSETQKEKTNPLEKIATNTEMMAQYLKTIRTIIAWTFWLTLITITMGLFASYISQSSSNDIIPRESLKSTQK